jgi:hypothetical protein
VTNWSKDFSAYKTKHYTRPVYTTPPAAKRPWIGLTDEEIMEMYNEPRSDAEMIAFGREVEAKLKEKNAAAQPAVPDAMTSADIQEHIEYVAGWNDCRAEMLKGMK